VPEPWYLVLIIWGAQYSDENCNQLISSAYKHSSSCAGVVVLTDRMDRKVDNRATLQLIPTDFNRPEMKKAGYPIKICLFDIECIPQNALCFYLDLDSVLIADPTPVLSLIDKAKLWTIDVFPRRFSAFRRFLNRVSNGKKYVPGNSSAFLFRNGFVDNPTSQYRKLLASGKTPADLGSDDRFIGWSCQQILRGFPTDLIAYFRIEFLAPTKWLAYCKAKMRNKDRKSLVVITFAGARTKRTELIERDEDELIIDHHNRVGYWNPIYTSGVSEHIEKEVFSTLKSDR